VEGRAHLHRPWRHRFALLTTAATLALIFVGGLVTSTGSGLAVPDRPLSYGMLMPPMVGGIFYEHGHRMVAAGVGFLTLVLALWTAFEEPRRGVRRLAWGALAAVVAQGALGGLTVLFLLPRPVSVSHACLAQTFLCIMIALAYATSREWLAGPKLGTDVHGLRRAALLATALVFVQLLTGALTRHLGPGREHPEFALAFGRLLPPLESAPLAIHLAHRAFALVVLAAVVWLLRVARRSGSATLDRPARLALGLALLQAGLGVTAVVTQRSVIPTTAHVAIGAALLGACWFAALRALRRLDPAPAPRAAGSLAGAGVPA
jgi:cytochrome c oxidase assembly protein subunit 15